MTVLIRLCLALIIFGVCRQAGFAAFPDRAIQIVVPFPPGGPVDVVAHIVAPPLGERLGQSVNIDNVAGDDGIKGSDLVAKAPPDGYTLLLASSTYTIHPGTYGKLPFDTEKAFAPVSLLVASQLILVVNPSLPVDSVEELIAYAKSHPGKLRYASGGLGGPTQLAFELLKITTGIDITHAPFDGGAAALSAVADDKAQVMLAPIITALTAIPRNRLSRIIGNAVMIGASMTCALSAATASSAAAPPSNGAWVTSTLAVILSSSKASWVGPPRPPEA